MKSIVKLTLRIPQSLHEQIKAGACTTKRYLNSTIIQTLRQAINQ
ncbi:MAG TPA: Arc family DNA-binding protein [bacterium]|nr:Arc family DNA-binding protein [bacterium]